MKTLFIFFAFFLFAVNPTRSQDTIHVPADYTTIQAGINAANNGDLVLVAENTYYENISFKGKAITVASHFVIDGDTNHINNTIINGSQPTHPDSGSVVTFNSGEDTNSVLCGFTITGGTGTFFPAGSPPSPPMATREGGGILCFMSGASIIKNNIINNECINDLTDGHTIGGGIGTTPPGDNSFIILDSNKIQGNIVWSKGNSTSWEGAWAQGGGVAVLNNGLITGNEILLNVCKSDHGNGVGGGVRLMGGTVSISKNIIDENKSFSIEKYAFAGGISCSGANTIIDSNRIINNSIDAPIEFAYGAGIYFDLANDTYWAIVKNNFISNNFSNNTNSYGGAIGMWTSSPKIFNNIITYNSASYGGALHAFNNSKPVIINNTVTYNNADNSGGALYSEDASTIPLIINTILWGNSATVSGNEIKLYNGGNVTVRYSNVTGGWTGEGNIDSDPLLADTLFHLSDSSPCIGAGIDSIEINGAWYYAPPFCFEGNPRPNPLGSKPDIGACESPLAIPVGIENEFPGIPKEFALEQNYPNPFNPTTTIRWQMPEAGIVMLKVYDILGNEIATLVDEFKPAGSYEVEFSGSSGSSFRLVRNLSSGIYFYQLRAGDYVDTKKMIYLK